MDPRPMPVSTSELPMNTFPPPTRGAPLIARVPSVSQACTSQSIAPDFRSSAMRRQSLVPKITLSCGSGYVGMPRQPQRPHIGVVDHRERTEMMLFRRPSEHGPLAGALSEAGG